MRVSEIEKELTPPAPAPAPIKEEEDPPSPSVNPADDALAIALAKRVTTNHPGLALAKATPAEKAKTIRSWAVHVRRLREIDKHTEADIRAVIDWCQSDSFWRKNILSAETLRKKWDQLVAQMGSKAPRPAAKISEQPKLVFMVGGVEVER